MLNDDSEHQLRGEIANVIHHNVAAVDLAMAQEMSVDRVLASLRMTEKRQSERHHSQNHLNRSHRETNSLRITSLTQTTTFRLSKRMFQKRVISRRLVGCVSCKRIDWFVGIYNESEPCSTLLLNGFSAFGSFITGDFSAE